jgi:hypothetical protein
MANELNNIIFARGKDSLRMPNMGYSGMKSDTQLTFWKASTDSNHHTHERVIAGYQWARIESWTGNCGES